MFHSRETMIDMYDSYKDMQSKRVQRSPILVVSEFSGDKDIEDKEYTRLHKRWGEFVLSFVHEDDPAYLVNEGNILILMENVRMEKFQKEVKKNSIATPLGTISSETLLLTDDETEFLLS